MLKYLLEKEFKQLRRNPFMLRIIVAMPIMMMLVFPYAANQEIKGVRVSVVDNDRSTLSERLSRKIDASTYLAVTGYYPTYSDALHTIESHQADVIVEVENEFEKNLITSGVGRVMISANSVNGTKGSLASSYLNSVVSDYSSELQSERGLESVAIDLQKATPSFRIIPNYKFNPHLEYRIFMVPALMVMLLTMLTGFLPALNIVSEKEKGTIEQINVTPVGKISFVVAKLIPYWIIGFAVLSFCMLLALLVHGLHPAGSLLTIYLFATLYILVVSGMGLIVSNYSSTMQQAMFVMYFVIMILLLMSGLFTPINSMPEWAKWVAKFNPLSYFIQVMRMVYLKGSSFSNLLPHFFILSLFAIALNGWAVWSYKKSQ